MAARQAAASQPTDPTSIANFLTPSLRAEQPTMLSQKFGEVTTAVQQLCFIANRLGRRYGVHGEPYEYDGVTLKEDSTNAQTMLAMLREISRGFYGFKFFQITRSNKVDWAIFHGKAQGLSDQSKGIAAEPLVPITECSVEIKRLCLRHSNEIFGQYLKQVSATASEIDADLVAASKVIQDLANI
jgi:hypothetical protein